MPRRNEFIVKNPYIILNVNKRKLQLLEEQGEEAQNAYIEERKNSMIESAKKFKSQDLEADLREIEEAYSKIATKALRDQFDLQEQEKKESDERDEYEKKLMERFGRTYSTIRTNCKYL